MEAEETDPLIERTEPPDRRSRFARVKGHMRSSMRSGFAFWTQRASAWRGALFRRRMEQLPELEEPIPMERAPTILIDPEIAEQLLHYRTSCMQHTEDRAEECAQRIATWKALVLSQPAVQTLMIFTSRIFFVADLALDFKVGGQLLARGNSCWAAVCFFAIALTYLIMLIALAPKMSQKLQESLNLNCFVSYFLWILVGLPSLMMADFLIFTRFLFHEPIGTESFHYVKLRGLVETLEASIQTTLQGYIAFRLWDPCGIFPAVHADYIDPELLAVSFCFSFKNMVDQWLFLQQFAGLQAHGDVRRFLGAMMRLGDGLAPSGLYDALAKLRSVTCAFDLSKVSKKELMSLAKQIRRSRVLQFLTFEDASFLRTLLEEGENDLKQWVLQVLFSRTLEVVYFKGPIDQEIYKVFQERAALFWFEAPCLQRISFEGEDDLQNDVQKEPLMQSLLQGTWQDFRVELLRDGHGSLNSMDFIGVLNAAASHPHVTKSLGLLLTARAAPDTQGRGGRSLLYGAASHDATENVALLLSFRAEPNLQANDGASPMSAAAGNDSLESLRLLLKAAGNVNLQKSDGATPLYLAAYNNCSASLQLLLEERADPDVPKDDGTKAVDVAKEDTLEILRSLNDLT